MVMLTLVTTMLIVWIIMSMNQNGTIIMIVVWFPLRKRRSAQNMVIFSSIEERIVSIILLKI